MELLAWTLLLFHSEALGLTEITTSKLSIRSQLSISSLPSLSAQSLFDPTDPTLPHDPTRIRYRCRVAYDGTGFSGFQLQGEQRTIQKILEDVLQQRFGRMVRVVGAGRTDAGVHARGQAIHFDLTLQEHAQLTTPSSSSSLPNDESRLEKSMNRMLPPDIRIWNVGAAPAPALEVVNNQTSLYAWNVMRKCESKLYSYRLCLGNAMDPMLRHDRWQLDNGWVSQIDPVDLAEILQDFEGTHDFVCFAGALEANARKTGVVMSTIRTVHSCKLICEDDGERQLYRVDIYLDGALYKMVRNLVGTAIDVCRGKLTRQKFHQLLKEPSRFGFTRDDNPCKPAPPHGLTLERVFYPDDDKF